MKKLTRHLLAFTFMFSLMTAQAAHSHSIEYLGVTYENGNTTVQYKITSGSSPALSHWSLELCAGIEESDILSASETWEYVTSANQHEIYDGIKFDDGYNDGEVRTVSFTLAGEWAIGEINVRFKAGNAPYVDTTTQGPICEEPEASLEPIVPVILCVAEIGADSLEFEIGYYNPNPCSVAVSDDVLSVVTPAQYQDQFPTTFLPYVQGATCDDDPLEGPAPTAGEYSGPPTFKVRIEKTETLVWTITVGDNNPASATSNAQIPVCGGEFGNNLPIVPLLLCAQDLGNGNAQVMFGYYNPNVCAVTIPYGSKNNIEPAAFESAFPETFEPYVPGNCGIDLANLGKSSALNVAPNPEDYNGPVITVVVPTGTVMSWDVQVEQFQTESAGVDTDEPICMTEQEYCVSGEVLMDGQPVANAVVRLEKDNKAIKHYTDENGYYEFKNVPAGLYDLLVQGYPQLTQQVLVDGSEDYCHNREIDLGGCRELFAFYQPWFGSATNPDSLRRWIPTNLGSVSDRSIFETYDSNDPDIWEYHILLAWASDIDAFIVDWYGKDEYENAPLHGLLDAAENLYQKFGSHGFDFDIIVLYNEKATGSLEENLGYLTENVFTHPAYYHAREDKERPIFVYSPAQLLSPQMFRMTADNVVTQEAVYAWNWDPTIVDLADYVHTVYPWIGDVQPESDPLTGLIWGDEFLDTFYSSNGEFEFVTGSMWPGHDDRAFIQGQDFFMDKQDSLVYEWTWDKAHVNQPHWLVLTSFNDFNRGTHVEPSEAHDLFFVEQTQIEAYEWKGECSRNLGELALQVPPELFIGRKTPLDYETLEAALMAFFEGKYEYALALLRQTVATDLEPDNSLSFVSGSEYFAKGTMAWDWSKAVDGDLSTSGTALVRGDAGDPKGTAWAIYEFADKTMYKFNYAVITTDDGTAKANQADQFEIWVSTTTDDMSAFTKAAKFYRKGSGETQWYGLGEYVKAKYVMVKVLSPYHYSGGYRQLVEFRLDTNDKTGPVQAIEEDNSLTLAPTDFVLQQNYPNPFNPTTTIAFEMPEADNIQLHIYNVSGQLVKSLLNENMQSGYHRVVWNATDDAGNLVPSGIYYYRIQTSSHVYSKKMVLLK